MNLPLTSQNFRSSSIICRVEKFMSPDKADLYFSKDAVEVTLSPQIDGLWHNVLVGNLVQRVIWSSVSVQRLSLVPPPTLLNASKSVWNNISGRNGSTT